MDTMNEMVEQGAPLREMEAYIRKAIIAHTVKSTGGKKGAAARRLGISRSTMSREIAAEREG